MSTSQKAIPVPTERDSPYWEGAKEGKLVLQQCSGCGLYSAQPRLVCPRCRGEAFRWSQVSGRGRIHSYTIVHQTTAPGFQDDVPYVVVHVQIDEEPTCYVTANLLVPKEEHDTLSVDLPVIVEFEERDDAVLPQFRLAAN
ncbi:MAG: OB-fold domain-containing protein [Acidimicrobiaceae bacterium]|nr:OB-fold domain-containing protein [Acidimicrobiaceae bacterium]